MPASWCWKAAPSTVSPSSSPAGEGGTVSGGEGITVDVILPMEKAGSERVRRAAVARKLGISPSRIKDVRLVKESIDSRQKKILFQLRLLVGVDSPLPPERLPSRDYPSVRSGSPWR